jgi:PKD repeat protein
MGVALLALFLFIGGGAYIFLSTPPVEQDPNAGLIGGASPTSSLAIYSPETPSAQPTPPPTPTPFFFSIDPGSPSPSFFTPPPSFSFPVGPTPTPTQRTGGSTPTPTAKPTPTDTPPPAGPRAGFSWNANGLQASFTNKSKGNGSLSYAWNFGDNKTSTKANPSHTYKAEGQYTVTLVVTDSFGLRDSQTKTVTVTEPTPPPSTPPATETGTPTEAPTTTSPGGELSAQ